MPQTEKKLKSADRQITFSFQYFMRFQYFSVFQSTMQKLKNNANLIFQIALTFFAANIKSAAPFDTERKVQHFIEIKGCFFGTITDGCANKALDLGITFPCFQGLIPKIFNKQTIIEYHTDV